MEYSVAKDEFVISTDKNKIDIDYVHRFLSSSYWSPGVAIEVVKKALENSMCFGVYKNNMQIGYARMVTDKATFAYLADVFIDENYRGKGLGKWLVEMILEHPDLKGLRRIMLATKDAHKLYEQCGFKLINNPERYMVYDPAKHKIKMKYFRKIFSKMLQVVFIRQNTELVKQRLAIKNYKEIGLVDEIISLDDERKKLQSEFDETQAKLNATAKEIGSLMAKGYTQSADEKKQEVATLKAFMQPINEKLIETEKKLHDELVRLPNLPHTSVPVGKTSEENILVREGGDVPQLFSGAIPHWDLAKKYDLINFELGNKLTGSGFPVYKNKGAKLQRSLIQYFLDYNTAAGYTEYQPPLMVNEASAYGTGQLPDKEGQMYHVQQDGFYLIPTAEVPVTNIYRDEIVKENELPIKMTAYTPCFRREAGSYGKDVRGLNRLHQFDKVEIIQLVHPEKSYAVLEEMVVHVEKLLQSLNLPYRILKLCGGDMGFTSALTYDFEVYSAAQQKWLEVSSVSNFESFQTNRMKIRFKTAKGKMELVHSLNGSSLALPRIVAALLENNQTESNIKLPKVLHKYFGEEVIT